MISTRKGGNSPHFISYYEYCEKVMNQTVNFLHIYFVFLILYLRKMTLSFLPDCIIGNYYLMFKNVKVSCSSSPWSLAHSFSNIGISLKL